MFEERIFFCVLVASLPTVYKEEFWGPSAVTSPSGQGVIVQHDEHFYELQCQVDGCSWTILPQKLKQKVQGAVVFTLPGKYTCN